MKIVNILFVCRKLGIEVAKHGHTKVMVVAVTTSVLFIVVVILTFTYICWRKRRSRGSLSLLIFVGTIFGTKTRWTLKNLKKLVLFLLRFLFIKMKFFVIVQLLLVFFWYILITRIICFNFLQKENIKKNYFFCLFFHKILTT